MSIEFFQTWTWGPFQNPGRLQVHNFSIPFKGLPHVIRTSCLAEVSTGELNGTAGVALACFSSYANKNADGDVLAVNIPSVGSCVEMENCVPITIALEEVAATAMGGWTFYLMS